MASVSVGAQTDNSQAISSRKTTFAFGLVSSLFFMFGFITCLNDILLPHLKSMFTLTYTQASLIAFCFFGAYFIVSLPAGRIIKKWGYKKGIMLGLITTAVACALFYPASKLQSYPFFLFSLFILACGITTIQVAVNPFISILGPKETASSRLTLAQAFNSLGTTLAPIFGSLLILSNASSSPEERAAAVQGPYLFLSLGLLILAVILGLLKLPEVSPTDDVQTDEQGRERTSAWSYNHLILGALAIFCYVGAEVAIGSYIINFLVLPEIMNFSEAQAANYLAYYWGGAMIGRFAGAVAMRQFKPSNVLAFNAIFTVLLVTISIFLHGKAAMISILAVGLFNSIMFPTIFTLAIKGLGTHTAQASGILCMSIVGGAIVPLLQGIIADHSGLQISFVLPILCYLYIFYYGLKGHQS